MKQFLKYTFASALGLVLALVFVISIIGIAVSSGESEEVKITESHILKLKLSGNIQDRVAENPLDVYKELMGGGQASLGLNTLLANIKKAKTDVNISGIHLEVGYLYAGFASLDEIRNALTDFKESGKFITAYSEVYSQKAYYLASVATSLCIYPEGALELIGLNSTVSFYTDALKKIGIEPQIIRHGKFKAAVEPFMLKEMSASNREQVEVYMGSIWDQFLTNVSKERGFTKDRLNAVVDNFEVKTPADAKQLGLVDELFYKDQLQNHLSELMQVESFEDIHFIGIKKYQRVKNENARTKFKKDKIAVIYAQGEIQSGKGQETVIGSERISKAIRKARLDAKVKAIVLRVNSPGGSALASDVIWREMRLAKAEKPVVVSMGDVAASGGYYIACDADKIYASPTTITGSIGVFGVLMSLEELYTDKLGITFDQVKTNKFADLGTNTRPLSEEEYTIIQQSVVAVYDTFTSKVAQGRKMTQADVDSIGQGRVWSGVNALNLKLIDEFGGLQKAIEGAAELAELEEYRLFELPELQDPLELLLEEFGGEFEARLLKNKLGEEYKHYKALNNIRHLNGIQARMPYQFTIE